MSEATQEREAERYPQIVRAIRDTPWAILPGTLATIIDIVGRRLDGERLSEEEIKARVGGRSASRQTQVAGSVAVLPIYGAIIPKATMFSEMSGGTSIQGLQADFREALADDTIKSIVFDVDSPGGMTDMVPEFAAEIRAARGQKPMVAVANTRAASAAYWLATQADELVVTPSGDVGSVGVFAAHEDVSAMQEKLGVKTTFISAGKFKTEGNAFEPLTDEARAAIQERVDEMYDTFAGDVAAGLGVSVDAVKNGYGEGRMLSATKAKSEGMVHRIDTLEGVVARLQNPSGRRRVTNGGPVATATPLVLSTELVLTRTQALEVGLAAGPIQAHSTATSDAAWDGPANKARLKNDQPASFRKAFAWYDDQAPDPDGDGYPDNKGDYKFIHHEVSEAGDVGAANVTACSQGIGVLNGGRTGTTIPDGDRQGVYDHLAKHLRDAGREPPPLKSSAEIAAENRSFSDEGDDVLRSLDALVSRAESLRALTGPKREQMSAIVDRCQSLLAAEEDAQDDLPTATVVDELEVETVLAATGARLRGF